jgi:TRAP-type transport system periplasmic protein
MHSPRPRLPSRLFAGPLLLALGIVALSCPVHAAPAEVAGETLKLKAAHVADETFAWHRGLERFRDAVRAKTGGAVDVQIYANGVLGSEKDYVQYLVQGVLDVATVSPASASSLAKEVGFLDLPYLWKDREHWERALDADVGQRMAEVLEKATAKGSNPGFHVLGYWGGSELHVASRKQVYQVGRDLAGVKIRGQDSQLHHEMWTLLGAHPMVMPFQTAVNALQNGSLDAVDGTLASLLNGRLYDTAPHVSLTGHVIGVRPLFMSGHTWKKLTPAQQKAILEAAKEATAVARASEAQQAQDAEAQLRAKPSVRVSPFKEKPQMRDQTEGVRRRVAAELALVSLLDAVDAAWTRKK